MSTRNLHNISKKTYVGDNKKYLKKISAKDNISGIEIKDDIIDVHYEEKEILELLPIEILSVDITVPSSLAKIIVSGAIQPTQYRIDGGTWQSSNQFFIFDSLQHLAEARDTFSRVASSLFTMQICDLSIDSINSQGETFGPGSAYIDITASSSGVVEYSIDGVFWVSTGFFGGLSNGIYTVYARDQFGCVLSDTVVLTTLTEGAFPVPILTNF